MVLRDYAVLIERDEKSSQPASPLTVVPAKRTARGGKYG